MLFLMKNQKKTRFICLNRNLVLNDNIINNKSNDKINDIIIDTSDNIIIDTNENIIILHLE